MGIESGSIPPSWPVLLMEYESGVTARIGRIDSKPSHSDRETLMIPGLASRGWTRE